MASDPIPPSRAVGFHSPESASLWSRLSTYVSENKVVAYTIGAVIVVAGAGGIYYVTQSSQVGGKGKTRKERRSDKSGKPVVKDPRPEDPSSKPEEPLPEIDEEIVKALTPEQRKEYAGKLKAAGNRAYNVKDHPLAIELYTKAILCKADAIFYSNRSACFNALEQWDKVIEDTTAAISLDPEYVKALNRRGHAYEQLDKNSEALLDYTASCIIDGFRNRLATESVERLLKKVAEEKGRKMLQERPRRLPSSTFVSNYLQSFRSRPPPPGLEEDAPIPEGTGDYHLRLGLEAVERKTVKSYEEAGQEFETAMDLGTNHEAFALNWRGTFKYLQGDQSAALDDLNKSVELDPTLIQSYIKRASMLLELGDRDAASNDFSIALEKNPNDPDIYYHRAQLHFILGEFSEAAKDYQKSIDLDHDFIFSHIQLGVTQYKMGSTASSMSTFRRCIKNFETIPDVYNYYGELLLDQQKYQEAIEKFDTAVEMERTAKPMAMNVLPLINKALALFQWKQDFAEAEKLCERALLIDPDCDIAVATMAQLLLQQGRVKEALKYFEMAAALSRTEGEIVNALSYAEATRTQLEVQEKYPQLATKLQGMASMAR